jgi:hypothetical protein
VFVGLKLLFFLVLGSLASSSSNAANMSAMVVVVELMRERERGRLRYTSMCGEGESCMYGLVHQRWWLCKKCCSLIEHHALDV